MKIIQLQDPSEKSQVCEMVLRSLPNWFGIEASIKDYINDVRNMETWVAFDSENVGFISLNKHNLYTSEIHVMGILPDHHRKKIGSQLIRRAEESLLLQGFKFLTVKTLSESRPNLEYDQTRQFYLKSGFTPVEEFKTLWGPENPCLMLIKKLHSEHIPMQNSLSKNSQLVTNFWRLFSEQKWDEAKNLLHPKFVAVWPQSKERIIGPENFVNINRYYPGNHKIEMIHSFEINEKILTTVWIVADTGQKTFANSIFDIFENKIIKAEEYWAEPFPAPDWRRQWVDTIG